MTTANVYQSKYGYHPCNYETYKKLRKLHTACARAERFLAIWNRWYRKAPQNRVIRRYTKNAQGQINGYTIIGPRPEPIIPYPFVQREEYMALFDRDGKYCRGGVLAHKVVLAQVWHDIEHDFISAKYPKVKPNEVVPMRLTEAMLDEYMKYV